MISHLKKQFAYDYWANSLILDLLIDHQVSDAKSLFWINHILNAEIIWMDRIQHGSTMLSPQDMRPLANCKDGYAHIYERIIHFLESVTEEDIQKELNYKNSRGQEFSNIIVDILAHIINHSTHHRAQIAVRLREMDIPPPATDYIFYLR